MATCHICGGKNYDEWWACGDCNQLITKRDLASLCTRIALLEKVAVAARKIPNRWSPELEAALAALSPKEGG